MTTLQRLAAGYVETGDWTALHDELIEAGYPNAAQHYADGCRAFNRAGCAFTDILFHLDLPGNQERLDIWEAEQR